jgi:hypothetical protein
MDQGRYDVLGYLSPRGLTELLQERFSTLISQSAVPTWSSAGTPEVSVYRILSGTSKLSYAARRLAMSRCSELPLVTWAVVIAAH